MSEKSHPRVGLGVYVIKNSKFLIAERLSPHGKNTWSAPGGHLENGESLEECAIREVAEETGLKVTNFRFLGVTNDIFGPDKHYITISMAADWESGEPQRLEPNKCLGWHWVDLDSLPPNKFLSLENLLKSPHIKNLENELKSKKEVRK